MLEEVLRLNSLYDFYGELLTDNQNKSFVYYYRYDYSLSEISDQIGISRQGVSDNLKRARGELEKYEDILGLYEKSCNIRKYVDEYEIHKENIDQEDITKDYKKLITLIEKILEELSK